MSVTAEQAIEAIRRGEMIVVVDDEDRENEGDLICAAEAATPEALAFMVRHGSGIVCVAMARARLDAIIYRMIADRRASGRDHGDLLSMLLAAQDEDDGGAMTDTQVRDEAMTIFLAGHETTANALMWTWYLLSGAPEVEAKLHAEVDGVLQGRLPAMGDLASLHYVERIVSEAMRLYPPAWVVTRRVLEDDVLVGAPVPAGSLVILSTYALHRNPRVWAQPDRFDPERFGAQARAATGRTDGGRLGYLPFGAGPRMCIGRDFALVEGVLMLAAMAGRFRLERPRGAVVRPDPSVIIRPKGGLPLRLRRRIAG